MRVFVCHLFVRRSTTSNEINVKTCESNDRNDQNAEQSQKAQAKNESKIGKTDENRLHRFGRRQIRWTGRNERIVNVRRLRIRHLAIMSIVHHVTHAEDEE